MSDTYVNPDAPNADVTAAAVAAMRMGNAGIGNTAPTTGYYPGGYADPFAASNGAYSADSRANIGPAYPNYGAPPQPYSYPYGQAPTPMPQPPVQSAPPFNGLAEQKNVYGMCDPGWMNVGYNPQPAQPPCPITPYTGYPQGIDQNNYIYDYMRSHAQTKTTWGENYWTTQKPIDPPVIDWTPKPTQPTGYAGYLPPQDPYTGYGYGNYGTQPQQPTPVPNFGFPTPEESWLDKAKQNWKNL